MSAARAFNQTFFSSDEANIAVFESLPARLLRYEVGWAFYEGKQYKSSFSQGMMVDEALYKYIADIYNPTARIGDFYKGVIWRGALDPEAGEIGAIPIKVGKETDEAKLRAGIARVWLASSWDTNKSAHVLHGTVMGDAALYIRDDLEHAESRIEILHPSTLKFVEVDTRGFVKRYVIEEKRLDENNREVTYRETCEHGEGELIEFRTYRNNREFAWPGNVDAGGNPVAVWSEPYGFIPLVLTQHINEARSWGRAEIHPFMKKIATVDDQASILNDRIRIAVDPPLLANFKKGATDITFSTGTATTDRPKPGREQQKIIYVDRADATITPIVVALDIAGVSANIRQMLDALENDLPELRDDIQGNVATETLIAARSRVESKVIERRTNYDRGIVRASQMALAIGGFRGYDGYDGFDLQSFDAGKLNFSVADRPVFPESTAQRKEKIELRFRELDLEQIEAGIEKRQGLATAARTAGETAGIVTAAVDTPDNITSEKGLNGAQITSAIELLKNVSAGITSADVAFELLVSLGIDEPRARKMADASKKIGAQFEQDEIAVKNGTMPKYIFNMRNFAVDKATAQQWVKDSQSQRVPKVAQ